MNEADTPQKDNSTWPFAFTNGERNPASQALLDNKQSKDAIIKFDINNEPEALL